MFYPRNRPPRKPAETISISLFLLIKSNFNRCKLRHLQPERELARTAAVL
jgi:hypothetical protein